MKFLTSCQSLISSRAFLGALLLLLPLPMFATLGDNAGSVLTDQAQMKGTLSSTDKSTYVVHQITTSLGTVREFVSPAGVVFGVAWQGQFPPDFQQLLGPYYQQLQQAIAQQKVAEQSGEQVYRRRRGPVIVKSDTLVFSQGGQMRNFRGQAYIPQLVPQGVQTNAIQ